MKPYLVLLFALIVLYIIWEIRRSRTHIKAEEFPLSVSDLPDAFDGFRIAFLSDIHNEGSPQNIIDNVRLLQPDIVLFGGDMLHKRSSDYRIAAFVMEHLAKDFPTYAAFGNHEEIIKERFPDAWRAFYEKTARAGVTWLENAWIALKKGSDTVFLGGISVNSDYYYHPMGRTASDYLDNEGSFYPLPQGVRILLAHDPIQLDVYTAWGMDVVLSGHVHGGIIRLPVIGGLLSPARAFFPPRDNGRYQQHDTQMVVSRGLGNRAFVPRFWNPPHLPLIILKKETEHETI